MSIFKNGQVIKRVGKTNIDILENELQQLIDKLSLSERIYITIGEYGTTKRATINNIKRALYVAAENPDQEFVLLVLNKPCIEDVRGEV